MLKICKFGISMLYVNLYLIYSSFGRYIPYGTLVFGGIAVASAVFLIKDYGIYLFDEIRNEIISMTLFIFVCFVGAILVAYSSSTALSALAGVGERFVFLLIIFLICKIENNCDFPVKLCASLGICAAIIVLTNNNRTINRVSLSSNVSENALGNLMVLGIFCVVYLLFTKHMGIFSVILAFLSCATMFYVVLLTGSRKSFFAIFLLGVVFLGLYILNHDRNSSINSLSVLLLVTIVLLLYYYRNTLFNLASNTSMYNRMYGTKALQALDSDEGRRYLYERAWDHFLESPLLGIGLNNFLFLHGSYTHSTYAEIVCGTGILGFLTYFYQYICISAKLFRRRYEGKYEPVFHLVTAFFVVYCFIGVGIGQMYDNISTMELSIIYAFINIPIDQDTDKSSFEI